MSKEFDPKVVGQSEKPVPVIPKLPRLPATHKIQKRPLLHPPIASPRTASSTQKIIYISARSPFISTIKRLRTFLSHIEKRATGPISFDKRNGKSVYKQIEESINTSSKKSKGGAGNGKGEEGLRDEEVILKATGKAIERLLHVAVWAQGQSDLRIRFSTGSVGAIDDVVARGDGEKEEGEEVDESSRIRRTSCLEAFVGLK